ncbi:hypothetical protein HYDPIDRAFT_115785 [Hydnomerulius pinastri MD-312]|uniref:NADH dehydrogenase [ubiquinone] 1 alpha subcomplex subunit n=1 Tax=Hydnomerulius pinastri MD-312 TaxID=994086 RepID=A0A0C9VUD6_9AGAM|nr:hypothetical protein HYDPIDRAFT_115785 [Hydnomerulius pinastri MD-312]
MSVFTRLWRRILKPTYFVGKDLEGNKYFEFPSANNGRPKRTVQYRRNDDMWAYVASGRRLPVQWGAWLTHTRPDVPSLEELQADLARQKRVQMNVAILEARDNEERERSARLSQAPHIQIPQAPATEHEQPLRQPSVATANAPQERLAAREVRDPWAEAKKGSDEPESWSPVARQR